MLSFLNEEKTEMIFTRYAQFVTVKMKKPTYLNQVVNKFFGGELAELWQVYIFISFFPRNFSGSIYNEFNSEQVNSFFLLLSGSISKMTDCMLHQKKHVQTSNIFVNPIQTRKRKYRRLQLHGIHVGQLSKSEILKLIFIWRLQK